MKIVTWNCCWDLGLETKRRFLLESLQPDVAVIPEAGQNDIESLKADGFHTCWFGEDKRHGLGVIARSPLEALDGRGKTLGAVKVLDPQGPFHLVAVWPQAKDYAGYVREILDTFKENEERWFTRGISVVAAGDFNSNACWNKKCPQDSRHAAVVEFLQQKGMVSAYHAHPQEMPHGDEKHHTYFHYKHEDKGYHLDYIFLPRQWKIQNVKVGSYAELEKRSDHCPLTVDVSRD